MILRFNPNNSLRSCRFLLSRLTWRVSSNDRLPLTCISSDLLSEPEDRPDALQLFCHGTKPIFPGGAELREFVDAELVEVTEPKFFRKRSKLLQHRTILPAR